jgi:hypothetical protein
VPLVSHRDRGRPTDIMTKVGIYTVKKLRCNTSRMRCNLNFVSQQCDAILGK